MAGTVLADSSALVAALRSRDLDHDWALEQLGRSRKSLLTCEAVISESFFLIQSDPPAKTALIAMLERGVLAIQFDAAKELLAVLSLMRGYADVPMSFADACLVRMAELNAGAAMFTIDKDFLIYRKYRRETIPLIAPW